MDSATGAFFGAVVGATLAGGGNLLLELFKRQDDRRGIAAAIAGEISAVLYSVKLRRLEEYIVALEAELRKPVPRPPPWVIVDTSVDPVPVMRAYVGKLGSLGGNLPRRVSHFYTLYQSIQTELRILAVERDPVAAANRITNALPVWTTAKSEGQGLVADLLSLSGCEPE